MLLGLFYASAWQWIFLKKVSPDLPEGVTKGPLCTLLMEKQGIGLSGNKKVLIKDIIGTCLRGV